MDDKPYKAISDLYKLFLEKSGGLDQVDIAYITGVLKTLTDLYWEPSADPEPKRPFRFTDITRNILGDK